MRYLQIAQVHIASEYLPLMFNRISLYNHTVYNVTRHTAMEEKQMRKHSILLVDDDPIVTAGAGSDLEEMGYEVAQ